MLILKKSLLISLLFTAFLSNNGLSLNYYSIANGSYASPLTWSGIPGVPPVTIPAGDTVFVRHNIASLSDIFVTGVLDVDTLVILGGNIVIEIDSPGYVYNRGTINILSEFHVDGFLYNSGSLTAEELHSDGYICNSGEIHLSPGFRFNHHGGIVECCGTIYAERIRFRTNSSVSGLEARTNCQTYCNIAGNGPPPILLATSVTATPQEMIDNLYPASSTFNTGNVNFCGFSGLPIELIDFNVSKLNNRQALIVWSTASERDNAYFNILRSTDGTNWESVAVINGAGNSTNLINYQITDNVVLGSINYYKIKQIDFNGKSETFGVKQVDFSLSKLNVAIYPNPSNGDFYIKTGQTLDINTVQIFNLLGENITRNVDVSEVNENTLFIQFKILKQGVYIISIDSETFKLILE